MPVYATDNFPCFDPTVVVQDVNISGNPTAAGSPACSSRVLFHLQRTWTATDKAGNTKSQSQIVRVTDDQIPGTPVMKLQLPRTWKTLFTKQTVTVDWGLPSGAPPPITRKTYAFKIAVVKDLWFSPNIVASKRGEGNGKHCEEHYLPRGRHA
jgi:hypothetical protein